MPDRGPRALIDGHLMLNVRREGAALYPPSPTGRPIPPTNPCNSLNLPINPFTYLSLYPFPYPPFRRRARHLPAAVVTLNSASELSGSA